MITDYYWIYFQFKLISTYGPFKTQDILVFAPAKNTMSILMAFHLIKKKKKKTLILNRVAQFWLR